MPPNLLRVVVRLELSSLSLYHLIPHLKDIKIPFARCLTLHRHRNLNGIPRVHRHSLQARNGFTIEVRITYPTARIVPVISRRVPSKKIVLCISSSFGFVMLMRYSFHPLAFTILAHINLQLCFCLNRCVNQYVNSVENILCRSSFTL